MMTAHKERKQTSNILQISHLSKLNLRNTHMYFSYINH